METEGCWGDSKLGCWLSVGSVVNHDKVLEGQGEKEVGRENTRGEY